MGGCLVSGGRRKRQTGRGELTEEGLGVACIFEVADEDGVCRAVG